MAEHSFNTEFAKRFGIEEAIIFGNIYYWCLRNKENNINLQKGKDNVERYYTFNSISSIQSQYDYIALSKVYRVIEKLEDEGLIVTGCFNKRMGDRTRWYAITEKGEEVYLECTKTNSSKLYDENPTICKMQNAQFSKCNLQNETNNLQIERHNSQNETNNLQNETNNLQNETTLPNLNTDIDSDITTHIECGADKSSPPNLITLITKPFLQELFEIISEHNKKTDNIKKLPFSEHLEYAMMKEFYGISSRFNDGSTQADIKQALVNYLSVLNSDSTWKTYFSWNNFCDNYKEFLPKFFSIDKYLHKVKQNTGQNSNQFGNKSSYQFEDAFSEETL